MPEATQETLADLRDLTLVLARAAADTGLSITLDEVLKMFGYTGELLAALLDDE